MGPRTRQGPPPRPRVLRTGSHDALTSELTSDISGSINLIRLGYRKSQTAAIYGHLSQS